MTTTTPKLSDSSINLQITARRQELAELRERARKLFDSGASGAQIGTLLSNGLDAFLVKLVELHVASFDQKEQQRFADHSALIAVGGTGRAEISPYSDTDLLFLYEPQIADAYTELTSRIVRDCWDVGLKLGHAVRTIPESISMARQEPQVATALVDSRRLLGSDELASRLARQFHRRVVRGRLKAYISDCIAARLAEREEYGATVFQLEPDVKRSLGGLRDIHLVRWLGYGIHSGTDLNSLRLCGALDKAEARDLAEAYEFLMRVRADLHFHANRPQDVLIRDEQLRITRDRGFEDSAGLRGVERFMQAYFRHSSVIAETSHRFVREHRPRKVWSRVMNSLVAHRFNHIFKMSPEGVTVIPRERQRVCSSLEGILQLFYSATLYGSKVSHDMLQTVRQSLPQADQELTAQAAKLFRRIMRTQGCLGLTLRDMFDTGVLELVVPPMRHARCLLQFNQYHSYTVDEHTFRALEILEKFEHDESSLGTAYRSIRHKATLHLAMLLHDVGKGFDKDHSEMGRDIALGIGTRLGMGDYKHDMMTYLVHKHLEMAHVAFRRDISDPATIMAFARSVGSPEILSMLYVLTAADVKAVGPGVWTDWKAELLAELYSRAMVVLSGQHYEAQEQRRCEDIKNYARSALTPRPEDDPAEHRDWIDRSLDAFSAHYFTTMTRENVVADLIALRHLGEQDVKIDGEFDPDTNTVQYRVIARGEAADGCFHKICGVLTARHTEILTAEINTSLGGVVVDRFRVMDPDCSETTAAQRIADMSQLLASVLRDEQPVEKLFLRHKRFGQPAVPKVVAIADSRVVLDNDSSEQATIVDVFAHDRPGLLFTLSKTLYDMGLSVSLAKIGTHLDQVVDVFYVCDRDGKKLVSGELLRPIIDQLTEKLDWFEREGYQRFTR